MNKSQIRIAILAALMIVLSGCVLMRLKASQRLGEPGLKLGRVEGVDSETVLLPPNVLNLTSKVITNYEAEQAILPKDTTYAKRFYRSSDGFEVFNNVVLMGTDRTSIHRPEFCLPGQGWTIEKEESIRVPIARPHPYELAVRKFTASRQVKTTDGRIVSARGLYLFWFVSGDELTDDHKTRMWSMAKKLLTTGTLQRWAYVSYFTACPPEMEAAALKRVTELIAAAVPEFQLTTGR